MSGLFDDPVAVLDKPKKRVGGRPRMPDHLLKHPRVRVPKPRKRFPFVDKAGKTFGWLTAVRLVSIGAWGGNAVWECECECGKVLNVDGRSLRDEEGKTSCGCMRGEKRRKIKVGDKFGNLTVLSLVARINSRGHNVRDKAECKCDCGSVSEYAVTSLIKDGGIECCRNCSSNRYQRGSANTRWTGCGKMPGTYWSKVSRRQSRLAKKGIKSDLTPEQAYELFINQSGACAISGLPIELGRIAPTASLDRIDSSLGYCLGNVQWVHKRINVMKGVLSDLDFIRYCRIVSDFKAGVTVPVGPLPTGYESKRSRQAA